jgi:hypothetical protein
LLGAHGPNERPDIKIAGPCLSEYAIIAVVVEIGVEGLNNLSSSRVTGRGTLGQ